MIMRYALPDRALSRSSPREAFGHPPLLVGEQGDLPHRMKGLPDAGAGAMLQAQPSMQTQAPLQNLLPLRVYLARAESDAAACARLHELLKPLEKAGALTVWHAGLPAAGQALAMLREEECAAAHLRVALLSSDLLNDVEAEALLALTPGLGVKIRECLHEVTGFRNWRVVDARPADEPALARAAQAVFDEIDAMRARLSSARTGADGAAPCNPLRPNATALRGALEGHMAKELIAELAEHYIDRDQIRDLWIRAGGRASDIPHIPRVRDLWRELLRLASSGTLADPTALIQCALEDRPENVILRAMLQ